MTLDLDKLQFQFYLNWSILFEKQMMSSYRKLADYLGTGEKRHETSIQAFTSV